MQIRCEPTGKPYHHRRAHHRLKTAFPKASGVGPERQCALVIMADTDIFDDRFWVQSTTSWAGRWPSLSPTMSAFVLNAVENLTGSDDLISLRTRANTDRPFTVVQAMQADGRSSNSARPWTSLQAQLPRAEQEIAQLQQGGRRQRHRADAAAKGRDRDGCGASIAGTRRRIARCAAQSARRYDRLGTLPGLHQYSADAAPGGGASRIVLRPDPARDAAIRRTA